jgi:hypothetical protein
MFEEFDKNSEELSSKVNSTIFIPAEKMINDVTVGILFYFPSFKKNTII